MTTLDQLDDQANVYCSFFDLCRTKGTLITSGMPFRPVYHSWIETLESRTESLNLTQTGWVLESLVGDC